MHPTLFLWSLSLRLRAIIMMLSWPRQPLPAPLAVGTPWLPPERLVKLTVQPLQPSSFTDSDRQWHSTAGPRPVTPALGHCSHLELTRSPVWPVVTVTV